MKDDSYLLNKKRTIIILQWLIASVTSYLMLFSKVEISHDPWAFTLVGTFFAGTLALYCLPEDAFYHRFFDPTLLLCNTLLILAAIYLNRDASWDLFLFYFLIIFLAGVGETMVKIMVGWAIISLAYWWLLAQQGKEASQILSDLFTRVPFLFGISVLYGYLLENIKREKRRAETAEQREHLKMDLVSALAHDIKNPLGIIMGYTDTMMDQLAGRSDAKQSLETLGRIQDNAQRIVKLVTGFLDASKTEAGKMDLARGPVQLNRLIREVGQQQIGDLRKKSLTLTTELDDELPQIMGDEAQLERVLWNLIGNAVKFTPVGGEITITSGVQDGDVCVSVKDTGIGIPQDELPHLFSEFRRLRGASRVEGTGLGLFIVKTIVEAHKGTVQAVSMDGQGSTFTVRFPISP
ncbi:MAG: sensor histidine kinase [Candidatus Binatia bacterium]